MGSIGPVTRISAPDQTEMRQCGASDTGSSITCADPFDFPREECVKDVDDVDEDETVFSAFRPAIKTFIVVAASTTAFMSPFAINIYMPAVPSISKDLGIDNGETLVSVTTYMIFQGLSPSFWAPLSDTYGRRPILILTFHVFLAANLGLSFTNTYWLLLVLRMLQACGASSAISIGAGCISDVSQRKKRGSYMGYFQTGTLIGPAVGPIVGGLLSKRWGWHAVFFFLSAFGGVYLVFMILFLPESLRALVGNGSCKRVSIWRTVVPLPLWRAGTEPELMKMPPRLNLRSMGFDKPWRMYAHADIALMITSFAFPFAVFTMVSSSLSPTLTGKYGYNPIESGLCYISIGVGSVVGAVISGKLLDRNYKYAFRKHGPLLDLHKTRLKHIHIYSAVLHATVIINGWLLDKRIHIAAPMVFQFILSCFSILYFNAVQTILVDLVPGRAASVTAALNIGRCLLGAAFVAAVQYVIDAWGEGWTFTLFGIVSFILPIPMIELVMRFGAKWRRKIEEKETRRDETKGRNSLE